MPIPAVVRRVPQPGDSPDVPGNRGLEVKIGPKDATGTAQTGSIAGQRAPDAAAANPTGQWNTYEITVAYNTVTVVLNGKLVNTYTATDPARSNVNSFIGVHKQRHQRFGAVPQHSAQAQHAGQVRCVHRRQQPVP